MATEILDVNTYFGPTPTHRADGSPQALVSTLEKHSVQWCLTLSTYGVYHSDKSGNQETMNACANFERVIPVATINPLEYYGDQSGLGDLAAQPFEMFRFFPQVQGWPLEFAPFTAVVQQLARTRPVPLMISVRKPGDISLLARLLSGYESSVILEGVGPNTLAESISVLRNEKTFYLETHALRNPDSLSVIRDTIGIDRVLFGSGAPGKSLAASLRSIQHSGLTPEEQIAVLGGNAHSLWHGTGG